MGLNMDFEITQEQRIIQKTVREFAKKEISPKVVQYDREERFPVEIVKKMGELGFMGGVVPECYGGMGMDYLTHVLVVEELSRVCPIMGCVSSLASGLVGSGILEYGNERQKRIYLTPLAKGEKLGGVGITEAHSGTDVAKMETRAYRDGEGYRLSGSKTWISMVGVADWFLTFASLHPSKDVKGICAFIVEVNFPGMSTRPIKDKLGLRPLPTGELIFEDCWIPEENLVGKEGEGLKVAMWNVDVGRIGVAASAIGLAQACLDKAIDYAKERIVFGQPIGRFQLVQSMIADMMVGIEGARLLTYRVAKLRDGGMKKTRLQSSMAKMYATDVAMMAATNSLQIHGAYGCSEEYEVSRHFRNAKLFQIFEGNNQLHKSMIAEHALGFR